MSAEIASCPHVLAEPQWLQRKAAHEARVRAWTDPHQARAARGERHPVYDFLFSYYGFRAAWLRRWHPGPDVALAGEAAREYLRWPEYREIERGTGVPPVVWDQDRRQRQDAGAAFTGVALKVDAFTTARRVFVQWLRAMLVATRDRPAFFGCFGLHEWAMVYRQDPSEIRHNAYPLRLPPDQLAQIVESSSICCSHFDAFRFFTAPAQRLNRLQPARDAVSRLEQRGCLHANMDLYKWAFKLSPFAPSELIADCFELARDIREVDMRASPYDLRALGFAPIAIETVEGRADYERHQRGFTARGEPLRDRLIALCERLLAGNPSVARAERETPSPAQTLAATDTDSRRAGGV